MSLAARDCEYVVHLAGLGLADADAETVADTDLRGTETILESCATQEYLPGGTSLIYPVDVARGMRAALTQGTSVERYILDGENLIYRAALVVLGRTTGSI